MRLPKITGVIRRRLLINFRADPDVIRKILPAPFAPKMHDGAAMIGICLIRLEELRPKGLPRFLGVSNENAAHRIAVKYTKECHEAEGVFILRRDTNSLITHLGGGRIFPGEHHFSQFQIEDKGNAISIKISSSDLDLSVVSHTANQLPTTSVFASLEEASTFFRLGSVGYSVTREPSRVDGLRLFTKAWEVTPLEVTHAETSFFSNQLCLPSTCLEFDCGLLMRNIEHEWHSMPDIHVQWPAGGRLAVKSEN